MDLAARLEIVVAENELLRAQIAELQAQLVEPVIFPLEWGLTATESRLVAALLARDVLTKDAALAAMYLCSGRDAPGVKIVDVLICKVRRKLRPFGIVISTRWGVGYFLDVETRARLKAAGA